jgi:F0F1-type ATP synthase epsilon subunit
MEVQDDRVVVVTETAEDPEEIDAERAKRSLDLNAAVVIRSREAA